VPLWAQLRRNNADASEGTVEALEKIVAAIPERLLGVKIVVRADSGFSREFIILNSAVEKTRMATITPLPELVGRYFRVLVG
jgi:hypothetical protein